jgi:hypothetical protein
MPVGVMYLPVLRVVLRVVYGLDDVLAILVTVADYVQVNFCRRELDE